MEVRPRRAGKGLGQGRGELPRQSPRDPPEAHGQCGHTGQQTETGERDQAPAGGGVSSPSRAHVTHLRLVVNADRHRPADRQVRGTRLLPGEG